MSTSSLEQAILKISKVMEDFDRKVQDSIEKLTNLDIARRKGSFLLNPTITFKEPMHKDQGKFKMIKGYLNPLKHPLLGKRRETNSLDQMGRMLILFGIRGEFSMKWVCEYDACKNRNGGETEETREPKCISKALSGISHHEHTQCEFFAQ
ncbi:hypothetical protein AAG906_003070 [Vitis piasezkii]